MRSLRKILWLALVTLFLVIFCVVIWATLTGPTPWTLYPFLLIWLARILSSAFPGRGPGHFANTHEFGPVKRSGESESAWQVRLAGWWLLGALLLPFSLAIVQVSLSQPLFGAYHNTVMPLFVVPLPIL